MRARTTRSQLEVSPSGEWLAFRENFHVYVVPMPPGGQIDLSLKTKSVPQRRASDIGGEYFNWIDGDTLTWTLGASLVSRRDVRRCSPNRHASRTATTHGKVRRRLLQHDACGDKPHGVVALTGARIITMNGDQVIENGMIVVRDNRIVAVGASGCGAKFQRTRSGWISRATL